MALLNTSNRPPERIERVAKTDNNNTVETIDGDRFNKVRPPSVHEPIVSVRGTGLADRLEFDERMLSTHILVLGGIGTGKTNAFYHFLEQISRKMSENDVAVIFDTKGDFQRHFYKNGDVVISNDSTATGPTGPDYWNIFEEVDESHPEESIREISRALFSESRSKTTNTYFPDAACDLFAAMMSLFRERKSITPNNKNFATFLRGATPDLYLRILRQAPGYAYVASHISDPNSAQTQGVIAEMNSVVNRIFIGNFAREGTLSIRDLVSGRGGRRVFIEYDIETGEVLTPVYNLLMDTGLKSALSRRTGGRGSTYVFVDEFKLLPHLTHIDDAANFGRSLGIKMMIGLQTVTQIYDGYGEARAKSIMSGFLNCLFFRVNNIESRRFIKEHFGECVEKITYIQQNGTGEYVHNADVVKDKDINRLTTGECIVALPGAEPFRFRFEEWIPRG